MDFSLVYLFNRFFYRIADFFHHWYVDGSRVFGRRAMVLFTSLDQTFAVRVTLEHIFEPLYKDYTVIGRIVGAFFRIVRVAMGLVVYVVIGVLLVVVYLAWLAIPVYVAFRIVRG